MIHIAPQRMLALIGRRRELAPLLKELPAELRDALTPLLDQVSPADAAATVSTWLEGVPIALGILPETVSRYDSVARPDQIEALTRLFSEQAAAYVEPKELGLAVTVPGADEARTAALAVARALPRYQRKTQARAPSTTHLFVHCSGGDAPGTEQLEQLAEAVQSAAEWMDTPADVFHPDAFVATAQAIAKAVGARCDVLRGQELHQRGFGGLWNVGRAAQQAPALVVLTHEPERSKEGSWAWVGKGIVYDSGGLSLKSNSELAGMKGDMGGAAAALAAFSAAARLRCPVRIHAVLCIAENAIGPEAMRVDDVLTIYSGKTVEVRNTDAEGRLVLADGVAYAARDLGADTIVDLATLTDGAVIATGRRHASIVSNDASLERAAVDAGRATGDLVHPLPFCPELHRPELRSEVADMCNVGRDSLNANACVAAQFIHDHLGDFSGRWLHVDIEGPSRGHGGRATGFGVGLLLRLVGCLP